MGRTKTNVGMNVETIHVSGWEDLNNKNTDNLRIT